MTKLKKRILSSLFLAPLILFIIYNGGWPFGVFIVVLYILALKEWINLVCPAPHPIFFIGFGCIYIALAAFGLYNFGVYSLILLVAIWASDSGAYVCGKYFEGPKLCPTLSPNKTWAGFIGAVFMSALVVGTVGFFIKNYTIFIYILGGIILGVLGQAGDLLVSFLKRRAQVKDTGNLIPGHGGILDRIDSLILPFALIGLWVLLHT